MGSEAAPAPRASKGAVPHPPARDQKGSAHARPEGQRAPQGQHPVTQHPAGGQQFGNLSSFTVKVTPRGPFGLVPEIGSLFLEIHHPRTPPASLKRPLTSHSGEKKTPSTLLDRGIRLVRGRASMGSLAPKGLTMRGQEEQGDP